MHIFVRHSLCYSTPLNDLLFPLALGAYAPRPESFKSYIHRWSRATHNYMIYERHSRGRDKRHES